MTQECDSSSPGPGAQGSGGHSRGSNAPTGQAEAGRTQNSKDAPAAQWPQGVQISDTHPQSIQAPADWELW